MIAKEFPENVATMFAILETFFGIGLIVGPTVGGALYEAGGFTLPFVSLGMSIKDIFMPRPDPKFPYASSRWRPPPCRSLYSLHITQRTRGCQPADREAIHDQGAESPLHPHGCL